jgi:hypothetical protein
MPRPAPGPFIRVIGGKLLNYITPFLHYKYLLTAIAAKRLSQCDRSKPTTAAAGARIVRVQVNLVILLRLHKQRRREVTGVENTKANDCQEWLITYP